MAKKKLITDDLLRKICDQENIETIQGHHHPIDAQKKEETRKMLLVLDKSLHKEIRIISAKTDQSMKKTVEDLLWNAVRNFKDF